jgi:poly(hydroxyalkanoate) depolymerase family esterase
MKTNLHQNILEATRLTRAGQINEATSMLQGLLGGQTGSASSPGHAPEADTVRLPPGTERVKKTGGGSDQSDPLHAASLGSMKDTLGRWMKQMKSGQGMPDLGGLGSLDGLTGRSPASPSDIAPDKGQYLSKSFSNQAGTRAFKLYVPSGYRGQALPLVVMLHGCTQSPDDFAAGTRMNMLAEEQDCFVIYPEQATSANHSKCWNWFNAADQNRDQGEPSLIAGITRQVMSEYTIDPQRVYVAGLSAGGAAAAIMGATYPDLYAAIGVHSGLACGAARDLPSALTAMRQGGSAVAPMCQFSHGQGKTVIPTIVFHGDNDKTVHPRNGDQVLAASVDAFDKDLLIMTEQGSAPGGHAYSRTTHADSNGNIIFEQWAVHGAGHAWSGGSSSGSYTDPRGPDATREMLRFFLATRRT